MAVVIAASLLQMAHASDRTPLSPSRAPWAAGVTSAGEGLPVAASQAGTVLGLSTEASVARGTSIPPATVSGAAPTTSPDGTDPRGGAVSGWGETTATSAAWANVTVPGASSPSFRSYMGGEVAYDPAEGYVLLFGGFEGYFYNDTWEFNGSNWTELYPPTSPPPLDHASMAWDPVDGYMVLFGGLAPTNSSYDATWKFANGTWTQLSLNQSPSERWGAAFTWDATDGYLVLFGGCWESTELNDTWSFVDGAWTEIAKKSAPTAREDPGFAFDALLGKVVMFGGWSIASGYQAFDDTWEYVGGAWSEVNLTAAPSPRGFPEMAYLPTLGTVVLYGGENATFHIFQDTWWFRGGTWSEVSTGGSSTPGPDALGGFAFDPEVDALVMYGGASSLTLGFIRGTWEYYTLDLSASLSPAEPEALSNATLTAVAANGEGPYEVAWTFADGSQANGTWVSREFETAGEFPVSEHGTDARGVSAWYNFTVTILPTFEGVAEASPLAGVAPLRVTFAAQGVGGLAPYAFAWSSGESSTASGPSGSFVYAVPGQYEIVVVATDASTGGWARSFEVNVSSAPATVAPLSAAAWANRTTGDAALEVGFGSSATGGVAPLAYAWTFGDGSGSSQPDPSHEFDGAGTYGVSVTVRDASGTTATSSLSVTVFAAPTLSIAADPARGAAPLSVGFTASVSGGEPPVEVQWAFGDGGFATGNTTAHRYATAGTYNASALVVDGAGVTASRTVAVTVTATPSNGLTTPNGTTTGSSAPSPPLLVEASIGAAAFAVGAAVGVGAILLSRRARRD